MKISIITTLLPLVAAIPTQYLRPLDPVENSELFRRHINVLEAQSNESIVSPAVESSLGARDLDKRFIPFIALAGISLNAGAALSKAVGRNLKIAMKAQVDEIWDDDRHCRMYFQNVGGADCHVVSLNRCRLHLRLANLLTISSLLLKLASLPLISSEARRVICCCYA